MKKIISLIKATLTDNMNIFKINTKKQSKFSKIILPIFLTLLIISVMYSYSETLILKLNSIHMEVVLLTIFVLLTSIMTLVEGIYKSGSLLFNCKDDNLLFSLPIKRSTVLFIRIFKFYLFELLYNSLFIIPAMIVYAKYTNPNLIFYIVSIISLLLFPIIPILLSCIIGLIISYLSSKFKNKNIISTIITFIFLIGIMYFSYNSENLFINFANNATDINNFIIKLYYPAGAYINLITNFNIINLLIFIIINLLIFGIVIFIIGNIYFNVNTSVKSIKTNNKNNKYVIKTLNPIVSLIKKEINRFINSTVFITNAGFGLVLFIIGCILISVNYDNIINNILSNDLTISMDKINNYLPVICFLLICFSSLMTSITSSMISLEGKSFNILKSIPIKPYIIVLSKILAAILIMIPCIIIGDIILFIRFKFNIIYILLLIFSSIILPLVSETFGIIINLKYPKMDAKNDTEVVKQSMSSMISVFTGMAFVGITAFLTFLALYNNISSILIILIGLIIYSIMFLLLHVYLNKNCDKQFNNISI